MLCEPLKVSVPEDVKRLVSERYPTAGGRPTAIQTAEPVGTVAWQEIHSTTARLAGGISTKLVWQSNWFGQSTWMLVLKYSRSRSSTSRVGTGLVAGFCTITAWGP